MLFPARVRGYLGVEIRQPRRKPFYFFGNERNEVLAAAAAGFEVSDQEQTMKLRRHRRYANQCRCLAREGHLGRRQGNARDS